MVGRRLSDDRVGMAESSAVAVLIGLTITVTVLVGMSVLVFSDEGPSGPQANFTFDYVSESSALVVTHAGGDELRAGQLELAGPESRVTWDEVSGQNESDLVGPGDITQLSSSNAYGDSVISGDRITVSLNRSGNVTRLAVWGEES